jgi:hypothetical protein
MILAAATAAPSMTPSEVPPIVLRAAQQTVRTEAGIVSYRTHRVFDVHAGPSSRHDDMVFTAVYQDGCLVKMRIISDTIGGKQASAQQIAQTEQSYEHPKPGDLFDRPYDPRYVNDYQYEVTADETVHFTAVNRSAGYGDGTFTVDSVYDVASVTYSPTVLPPHATSGTVVDQRAQVLPNYWAVTQETQQYRGHYSIFGAAGNVVITNSAFQRFSTLEAALAALDAGRI